LGHDHHHDPPPRPPARHGPLDSHLSSQAGSHRTAILSADANRCRRPPVSVVAAETVLLVEDLAVQLNGKITGGSITTSYVIHVGIG
jgi:hypothetical protein